MYDLGYFTLRFTLLNDAVWINCFLLRSDPVKTHHFSPRVRTVSFILVDPRGRIVFQMFPLDGPAAPMNEGESLARLSSLPAFKLHFCLCAF